MTTQKIVLITGTSSGVGLYTALKLAGNNYKVYATMRDLAKSGNLEQQARSKKLDIEIMQLDVQDNDSVNNCVKAILEKEDRIDVLINNAGCGYIRSLEQASIAEIQQIFDINFLGTSRCIKAVMPAMRAQKSGKIICISSVGGLVGQPMNEVYCASKFAMEGLCESMATYLKPYFNIDICLIEPAGITTEFVSNIMKHVSKTGGILEDAYSPILKDYLDQRSTRPAITQTGAEVADVIFNCIEMENPPVRLRTSQAAETFCAFKTQTDPDGKLQQSFLQKILLGIQPQPVLQ